MMKEMTGSVFEAKNGVVVWVRPLLPEDAPYLVDLFDHMSSDSRYSRFHQPLDNVSSERVWREAEDIAHMARQVGFIAFADLPDQLNAPIGAARYVETGVGVAETAVSVRDDMQRQGVGTHLVSLLVKEARRRGVYTLLATIQRANQAIIHVLNRMPYPYVRTAVGSDIELALDLKVAKE